MALLEGHEFIHTGGLEVAYRASRAPQVLRVEVTTSGPSSKRSAPIILKRLLELMNAGAAGGKRFAPADGHGERLSGPWDGPDAFGPEYRWVLRVSAVAPLFLRTMVDQLRRCGWDQAVTHMRLIGELPPGNDEHSVDTSRMQAWLSDCDAYVNEWPSPSFAVSHAPATHARWTVTLGGPPDEETVDALKLLAVRWVMATASYVDDAARPVLRAREQLEHYLPTFTVEGNVFTAEYEEFHHRALAARAVLVNMLERFATQVPVLSVHVAHPGFRPPLETPTTTSAKSADQRARKAAARPTSRQKVTPKTQKKRGAKRPAKADKKGGDKKAPRGKTKGLTGKKAKVRR